MLCKSKVKNTLKEGFKNELLILIVTFPPFVMGVKYKVLCILSIVPLIFYPLSIFYYKHRHKIIAPIKLLHNGIFSGCISFLFELMAIAFSLELFQEKTRNIILSIVIGGYILVALMLIHILKKIAVEKDSPKTKTAKLRLASYMGAIFGISVARTLNSIDSKTFMVFLCIFCFFVSCLTLIGLFNIFKFQNLEKYNLNDTFHG